MIIDVPMIISLRTSSRTKRDSRSKGFFTFSQNPLAPLLEAGEFLPLEGVLRLVREALHGLVDDGLERLLVVGQVDGVEHRGEPFQAGQVGLLDIAQDEHGAPASPPPTGSPLTGRGTLHHPRGPSATLTVPTSNAPRRPPRPVVFR